MGDRAIDAMSPETLASIRGVFFEECDEHLTSVEEGLTALQDGARDPEIVNTVFRAVHSIKGSAGLFGYDALVRFAHDYESVLDEARSGRFELGEEALRRLLRAADVLRDLVACAREVRPADEARAAALSAELADLIGEDANEGIEGLEFQPVPVDFAPLQTASRAYRIRFRPWSGLYAKANDPIALIEELGRLGDLDVQLDCSQTPGLEALAAEEAYLEWQLTLRSDRSEAEIREVFEFVEDDCLLEITSDAPDEAPRAQAAVAAPSPAQAPNPEIGALAASPTIRVDLDRIDRLIDLVSELVISQSMVAQRISGLNLSAHSEIAGGLDELGQLTREIQDSVMAVRAQPVKAVFQRMGRLVREVEAATGKQVRLVTEGENTEVDRTIIERLTDPLTHMIRNAIDHGLESPNARAAAAKPETGTVRVAASHRAGRIIIEVSDDGAGIDRARVRAKAVENGIIAADAMLSDEEIDNLIFAPGFSTADTVSDLSGRGVGMDVVRSSVQALGGRISLTSFPGEGSTFTLSLPLTLAVMDGMLVTAGGQAIVAPLTSLVESFQPKPGDIRRLGPETAVLNIRGATVPVIDLGEALGYPRVEGEPEASVALLVESDGGDMAALLVGEIQGQRQVVIKSLEANYAQIPGIAAATILGDGRVALILDVAGLLHARRRALGRAA